MMRRLYYTIQLVILIGLMVSGTMLSLGFVGSNAKVLQIGTFGGWAFGLLSAVMYFFALILTFLRNTPKEFWSSLNTFNFGFALVATIIMFSRIEMVIVFAWIALIGLGISVFFYRWHIIESIYSLIVVHAIFFVPTVPFLSGFAEIIVLPIATMFIVVPTLCMACTKQH